MVLIERTGRGAMTALHVVSKNLELRLVVRLGQVREQQRLRHHAAIGFLCTRPDDDLALKYATAFVVEHRLEQLTTCPARNHVIHHERGIDMLAALEQGRAADRCARILSIEAQENLMARDAAAGRE